MIEVLERLAASVRAGERVALATVVGVDGSAPRAAGARMMVWADGSTFGTVGGGQFEWKVTEAAVAAIGSGAPIRYEVHLTRDLGMCCGGRMEVFIEPVAPEARLLIYGAGHVGQATATVARAAGFGVTVVDDREEQLTATRFPDCERVLRDPRRDATTRAPDARTAVLVTTHDHALDQHLVHTFVAGEQAWLGVIGSRAKLAKFFVRLRAAGVEEAHLARVSGPVGLDLGAETPGEIAVAIVAELIRVRRGTDRPPISLSDIPLPARGGDGRAHPNGIRPARSPGA